MREPVRTVVLVSGFALLAAVLGCGKGSSGSSTPTGTTPTSAPTPSTGGGGAQVFAQNCAKCHATDAGQKRGKGPSLAGIGSKADRPVDWIAAHVRNPADHKPTSGMPAFGGKMADPDIRAVAEYLATLK